MLRDIEKALLRDVKGLGKGFERSFSQKEKARSPIPLSFSLAQMENDWKERDSDKGKIGTDRFQKEYRDSY